MQENMPERVRQSLLGLFTKVIRALDDEDTVALGELSDASIRDAAIYQDEHTVSVAVLIYAFSKIVQHCCQTNTSYSPITDLVKQARSALTDNNIAGYTSIVKRAFTAVQRLDDKVKQYVQEVLEKARIKKGSKLYENGLSAARAAEMLGISQWELLSYIGKTIISDTQPQEKISANERLKIARGLFA